MVRRVQSISHGSTFGPAAAGLCDTAALRPSSGAVRGCTRRRHGAGKILFSHPQSLASGARDENFCGIEISRTPDCRGRSGRLRQVHPDPPFATLAGAAGAEGFFSEWNSSELVKAATSKGKKRELLTPTTFSLIHATDFADRYERQLLPLLRAGHLVLCDRYIYTAFARDTVRGCPPQWVRGIYSYAAKPDLTFFFKADLEVSLRRILDGRPELKHFEAGMDLRLSHDPYESFRIFQGRILDQYWP